MIDSLTVVDSSLSVAVSVHMGKEYFERIQESADRVQLTRVNLVFLFPKMNFFYLSYELLLCRQVLQCSLAEPSGENVENKYSSISGTFSEYHTIHHLALRCSNGFETFESLDSSSESPSSDFTGTK